MRTIVNAVISFRMVTIPVAVAGTVTGTKEPKFRTLHKKCGTPINQLNRCSVCEEDAEETVKGYEIAKNQFLHFTEEEIESVSSDKSNIIRLSKFVKVADIKPTMIVKSYWLAPPSEPVLAENYGLLYQVLAETKKCALGVETLWGTEHPCMVRASTEHPALQLSLLHLYEDLIEPDFVPEIPGREAKSMAKRIIDDMSQDFDPETDLVSVHRVRIQEMVAARVEKKDLPQYGAATPQETNDLMESLREEVAKIEKKKTTAKRKAAAKA